MLLLSLISIILSNKMKSLDTLNRNRAITICGVKIYKGTFINCLVYEDHWLLRYDELLSNGVLNSKIGSVDIDGGCVTKHNFNCNGVVNMHDIDAMEIMSKEQIKQYFKEV